jgi:hypothetical protein
VNGIWWNSSTIIGLSCWVGMFGDKPCSTFFWNEKKMNSYRIHIQTWSYARNPKQ